MGVTIISIPSTPTLVEIFQETTANHRHEAMNWNSGHFLCWIYIYLFDMIFFSYVEYWMQQRLEILENLVSRTIGESSTQNLARQLQTHGACTHCAKVQKYEQGKIGLQFFDMWYS